MGTSIVSVTEPLEAPRGSNARLIATIIVVVAFIAGLLVGAVADRIWLFRHGGGPERHRIADRIVEHLSRDLNLTPQQKQQVATIVAAHAKKMDAVWSNVRPQIRTEIDAANREISAVLTPEQREKFDKLRMRLGPRRGPGGPGGPLSGGGPPGPPPE
jgi:Spy/CpxP family protein refolding chaperone